jgi:hypothetical protein
LARPIPAVRLENVGVHPAERGLRPIAHALEERIDDTGLEIGARMGRHDVASLLGEQLVGMEGEYVLFHAHQMLAMGE